MRSWRDVKGLWSKPADQETRDLRHECHGQFDQLWKSGQLSRAGAYRWLQERMKLQPGQCHFSLFSKDQCREALSLIGEWGPVRRE